MEFNVNEYVSVKLNDLGKKILLAEYAELKSVFPKLPPYQEEAVDENGFTKFQLWNLMLTFGPHMRLGAEMPFETTIRIPAEG